MPKSKYKYLIKSRKIRGRRKSYCKTKRKIKTNKKRKIKTNKKRKQRGGACFGNGIGSNSYDPNFSVHNTNLLKLFPYKGGNLNLEDQYKNSEGPQF